ncbi:DUF4082 domain-containing protein [Sphaerisporangium sp. NBC_01403]|uniref:DUF4082 domain-containing protein n=1 Tax=Sphaerisporangium sp. NBC_01403 TaxID=2903599 RepID=UPI00324717F2
MTVVVINRDEAPVAAPKSTPVAAEVTLESSLWKSQKVVKGKTQSEKTPLELGTRFTASRNGEVAGVRFYKPASERGTHRGSLWDSDKKLLAHVTFTGETRSGWQEALFSSPVPIVAGRVYTVSYHTGNGGYVAQRGAFAKPVSVGPLTAEEGVFSATEKAAFPSRRHRARINYYVDVIFRHRERRSLPDPTNGPEGGSAPSPSVVPTVSTGPETSLTPTPTAPGQPSGGVEVTPTPTESTAPSPTPTRTTTHTPTPKPPTETPTAKPSPTTPKPSLTLDPTRQPTVAPTSQPTAPGGSWPNGSNTGVPSGVKLTQSKSITVTKDGTVIDGMEVQGEINVDADNVTIRNTRLAAAPGDWGIIQRQGRSGLTVENSEVFGNGKQRTQFGILNQGGDLTVRRVDIHTISNGILTEQGLIEDSYIHDPVYYSGDHTDMIMCTSGPPSGAKLVIRGNTVINTLDQTGAIALFQDFGVVRNVTVEANFLAGGGYALYGGAGAKGTSSNIKVVNNVFSRKVWAKGGQNGPVAYWDKGGSGNEWKGNVWDDGKAVPEGG